MCVFIRGQGYCQFKYTYICKNFEQNKIVYLKADLWRNSHVYKDGGKLKTQIFCFINVKFCFLLLRKLTFFPFSNFSQETLFFSFSSDQ